MDEREPSGTAGGTANGAAAVGDGTETSQKQLETGLPKDSAIALLGIYLQKPATLI